MASGMNGQSFAFNGYLPIDKKERLRTIKQLEKRSGDLDQTQLFLKLLPERTIPQRPIAHAFARYYAKRSLRPHPSHRMGVYRSGERLEKYRSTAAKRPAIFLFYKTSDIISFYLSSGNTLGLCGFVLP